jgi:hypothetical protein
MYTTLLTAALATNVAYMTLTLKDAERAHAEAVKAHTATDADWPVWYARFMVLKLSGQAYETWTPADVAPTTLHSELDHSQVVALEVWEWEGGLCTP